MRYEKGVSLQFLPKILIAILINEDLKGDY